jgi:hypothetical protein
MRLAGLAAVLAGATFGFAVRAPAQQFEGVVTIHTAHLTSDLVTEQIGEEPDERAREKLFALSLDQVVQIGGPADANVMQFKAGRMRSAAFEMPGLGSSYMLLDLTGAMLRTVAPSRRGYYEMPLRRPTTPAAQERSEAMVIEPLGRTQVINGVRCTGYRVRQGDQVSHVWTTTDPAYHQLMTAWLNMAGEEDAGVQQVRTLIARYGAPVMTQEFDEDGGYRIEVWTAEPKSLPDSLFVLPAGFTKLKMPGD